jgi:hypothetical protein
MIIINAQTVKSAWALRITQTASLGSPRLPEPPDHTRDKLGLYGTLRDFMALYDLTGLYGML